MKSLKRHTGRRAITNNITSVFVPTSCAYGMCLLKFDSTEASVEIQISFPCSHRLGDVGLGSHARDKLGQSGLRRESGLR